VLAPWTTVCEAGEAEMEKSGPAGQPDNLKEPMNVLQLNEPLDGRYSLEYQNVQSSLGSILKAV
jgi:hypothetical protein